MNMHSGRLLHLGLVRFSGSDSSTFLQGQVSNDTRRLAAGEPLLAAYSNPQGRVISILYLIPHSTGILAIVPRELVAPTLARMRKFVLRAKVQIDDATDSVALAGHHGLESMARASLPISDLATGYREVEGIGIARQSADPGRFWVLGAAAELEARGLAGNPLDSQAIEHDWRLADIRAGVPQIYAATSELFVAQMLNLDLIDGISFSKGCYTGQEIIARTQNLGRIKRRLARLRLPGSAWSIGDSVRLPDGRAGRLTELARIGADCEALAVVNSDKAEREEAVNDNLAGAELPLPYPVSVSA
jgi:folate-binding protein YgfZ